MARMSHIALKVGLLAVALALVGCGRSTADVQAWVAEVKARPAPPLDPLPVMQQFETFEYAAQDMRDPFSPPRNERDGAGSGPRPDPDRRKEPLEAFPLDSMRMVGTLGSQGRLAALILAPDRVVHRVRAGDYLGQNEGRVISIREEGVSLVELVSDGAGGWIERQAAITLDEM